MTSSLPDTFINSVTTTLSNNGYMHDAKIHLSDGSSFKVHKLLLASSSIFFQKLFEKDKVDEYRLGPGVTKLSFQQVLNWIYKQQIKLCDENVPFILKDADYLDCVEVVEQCSKYLLDKLCPDNAIGFLNYAQIYLLSNLIEKFTSF